MARARVEMAAAFVGFLILLVEFVFTAYATLSSYRTFHDPLSLAFHAYIPPVNQYLPIFLLALATLIGGVALYRSGSRRRAHWTWYVAVLSPLIAFLVVYRPLMDGVYSTTLPWLAPDWWNVVGNAPFSVALEAAAYLPAVAYVVAMIAAGGPRAVRRAKAAVTGTPDTWMEWGARSTQEHPDVRASSEAAAGGCARGIQRGGIQ